MACVDENAAVALLEGRLAAPDSAELLAHAAECDTCRELVAALAKAATLTSSAAPSPAWPSRRRGDNVGRYVVLGQLGEGGMGVVYLGYDPDLDRRVALKFLREPSDRQRLLREAQAVAKLSHPNIVPVFDVGTAGSELYVAMEYVEGATLREWLAAGRPWRAIVERFIDAGRGLAAAHAAGIVHRDFKPDNVIVAADGRARVLDFGLATHDANTAPSGGTPRYMAPEQLAGREAGPAADQYSFCVALKEALGQARVPARIAKLLERGLAREPSARYASLDGLLADLARSMQRKRTIGALALGGLTIGALAGVVGRFTDRDEDTCSGASAKLAGAWDVQRKATARAAFLATNQPYALFAWQRAEHALDRYAGEWVAMHVDSCKATNVRKEQSTAALDLRMSCLARKLHEVKATAELFARADRQTVEKAVEMSSALSPLAECADVEALSAVTPPPRDAMGAALVDDIDRELARGRALVRAGKLDEMREAGHGALARARVIRYEPAIVDALYLVGLSHELRGESKTAEPLIEEAFMLGESLGYDHGATKSAALLANIAGTARMPDRMRWAKLAVAIAKRRGASELDRANAAVTEATALADAAQYDAALERLRTAAAIRQRELGPAEPELSETYDALGRVLAILGKDAEALAEHRAALQVAEAAFGPDHPAVADRLVSLGSLLGQMTNFDEALAATRRALAIYERTLGPQSAPAAEARFHLGMVLVARGDNEQALAEYRRALAIREAAAASELDRALVRTNIGSTLTRLERFDEAARELGAALPVIEKGLGSDHPEVARALKALGAAQRGQGKLDAAAATLRRSLAIRIKTFGADHYAVASARAELGRLLATQGKLAEAEHELVLALAIRQRAFGAEHLDVADALLALGELHIETKQYAKAVDELSRARAVIEAKHSDPRVHAELRRLLTVAKRGVAGRARQARRR